MVDVVERRKRSWFKSGGWAETIRTVVSRPDCTRCAHLDRAFNIERLDVLHRWLATIFRVEPSTATAGIPSVFITAAGRVLGHIPEQVMSLSSKYPVTRARAPTGPTI
jgi:hypothetical protein